MRKFLFPLMVVLAGIMISGSTCTPDCCVPGTSVIAVDQTALVFNFDKTAVTTDVVTITVADPAVTWKATASAGWVVAPGSGIITITPVAENITDADIEGVVTIMAVNGDKATVTVRQTPFLLDPAIDVSTEAANSATHLFAFAFSTALTFTDIDEAHGDFPTDYYIEVGDFPDVASLTIGSETWNKTSIVRVGVRNGNFIVAPPFKVISNVLWIAAPLMQFEGATGTLSLGTFGSITTNDLSATDDLEMVSAVAGYGAVMTPPGSVVALNATPDASGRYLITEERLQGEAWVEWTVEESSIPITGLGLPGYETYTKAKRQSTGETWYNILGVGDNGAHTSFNSSGYFAGPVLTAKTEVIDYYYIVPNHGNVRFQITTEDIP